MARGARPLTAVHRQIVVAPLAQRQIDGLLRESRTRFGEEAARRYAVLLSTALHILAANPRSALAKTLDLDRTTVHLFHLRHAKPRVPAGSMVRSPRHVIAYRFDEARLEVAQLLHERMDLPAHLR